MKSVILLVGMQIKPLDVVCPNSLTMLDFEGASKRGLKNAYQTRADTHSVGVGSSLLLS